MKIYLLIAILIIILVLLYFTKVRENFDLTRYNTKANVEFRECKIINVPPELKNYCSSDYKDYGKLQLINEIIRNKNQYLMRVYEYKKENNLLDDQCEYNISGLQEINKNNNTDLTYPKKNIGDPTLIQKYGSTTNWSSCFADENNFSEMKRMIDNKSGPLKLYEKPININDDAIMYELSFSNININEINQQICRKSIKNVNDNSFIILKIELIEDNIEPFLKPFKIKNCETIKYDPVTNNYDIFLENAEYIKSLFAITYNNNFVYYTPIKENVNIFRMKKDICGNPIISTILNEVPFSLGFIGIEKVIIENINRYEINDATKDYPTLEVTTSFKCNLNKEFEKYINRINDITTILNKRDSYKNEISLRNLNIERKIMSILLNTNERKEKNENACSNIMKCAKDIFRLSSDRIQTKYSIYNINERIVLQNESRKYLFYNKLIITMIYINKIHVKIEKLPLLNKTDQKNELNLYSALNPDIFHTLKNVYENNNLLGINSINNTMGDLFDLKTLFNRSFNEMRSYRNLFEYYKAEIENKLYYSITTENEKIKNIQLKIENALADDITKYKDRNLTTPRYLNKFISQDNCIYIQLNKYDNQCV